MSKVRGLAVRSDDTKRMEDEARAMEMKLDMLRKTLDSGGSRGKENTRWKSGRTDAPLTRGFAKDAGKRDKDRKRVEKKESRSSPTAGVGALLRSDDARASPSECGYPGELVGATAEGARGATRAGANLLAAVQSQSDEAAEVEQFLSSLGLDRYVSLFTEHGFDCMEVVREMEESHMKEIGMATGHALKLRKRLAELNPRPAAQPALNTTQNSTQKRVSFGGETAGPTKKCDGGVGTGTGGLLDGEYDEEANAEDFKAAVEAWRRGGAKEETSKPAVSPSGAPGSFWTKLGGETVNLERASTPLLHAPPAEADSCAQTGRGDFRPAPSEEKLCCYQCYKQFFAQFAVERPNPLPDGGMRRLCSEACAGTFVAAAKARAEELQRRQEKIAAMQEMQRAMAEEARVTAAAEVSLSEPIAA